MLIRAPLLGSGSLTTWTMISCPAFSRSSIDGRHLRPRMAGAVREVVAAPVVELQVLHRLDVGGDVADVEEGVALEADVDEGGLHPGQDAGHPPLVDVAHEPAMAVPLDEDLRQAVVLQDGDPGLVRIALDEHLETHGEGDCSGRAGTAAPLPVHVPRMSTPRMIPTEMKLIMVNEPP